MSILGRIIGSPAEGVKPPVEPHMGEAVKITGGKYNGLVGNVVKICDQFCSVNIEFEKKMFEEVVEIKFCTPLHLVK